MKRIYLDHAATTPVAKEVIEAMQPFLREEYGNASSLHSFGREAKKALENARKTIAKKVNASDHKLIFTSGGTESNNFAIKGIAFANRKKGKHIITSKIEHDCVLNSCRWLEKQGFEVTYLPVDREGFISLDDLEEAIRKDTILVSIMHANNEIGTIEPITEIGKICSEHDVYFHTDAVQTVGKIPVPIKNVDLLSSSAHKIYGPKGVGIMFIRKGTEIEPILHGGGHEHGMRSGTENIAGIVGYTKALELCMKEMKKESKKLLGFRKELIESVGGNVHFSFRFIEGESLILLLDQKGIEASTGSACSSKSLKPSHVLTAIGLKPEEAHGSLRLTMGRFTTQEDIEKIMEVLPGVVERLRKISPLGK